MDVKSKALIVVMGLVMVWPFWASAQDRPADNMQIVIEKVRSDKKLFIATNVQLTESEAKAFWPVYEQFQDELFLLRARTGRLISDFAGVYQNMTEDDAKNLLDEYITIETLMPKLLHTFHPKFRKVLPDTKILRYYQIESKINAALMYELAVKIPLVNNVD